MIPEMTLRRRVPVDLWNVTGVVARPVSRGYEIAFLRRAAERGGEITVEDADEHLLLGGRAVVARRVLGILAAMRLLSSSGTAYQLTDAGREAARTGDVFVPEQGHWRVWTAQDPLLPTRVVALRPNFAAFEARRIDRSVGRRARGAPRAVPAFLAAAKGSVFTSMLDGVRVRIDHLEPLSEAVDAAPGPEVKEVEVRALVRAPFVEIRGQALGEEGTEEVSVGVTDRTAESVWSALLASSGLDGAWDDRQHELRVGFSSTTDPERRARERTLDFPAPTIPGLGRFDPVSGIRVRLAPRDAEDRRSWARWRLEDSVSAHASEGRFSAWRESAADEFDLSARSLPSRDDVASASREGWGSAVPTRGAWHRVAAVDWGV